MSPPGADRFYLKAQFSLLRPGAHVRPHSGPTNERLVISMGLGGLGVGARIRVGNVWRPWREGEVRGFLSDMNGLCLLHPGVPHSRAKLRIPSGCTNWCNPAANNFLIII